MLLLLLPLPTGPASYRAAFVGTCIIRKTLALSALSCPLAATAAGNVLYLVCNPPPPPVVLTCVRMCVGVLLCLT